MDKDTIILKYEQERVSDIQNSIVQLSSSNEKRREQLEGMQKKLDEIYLMIGKKPGDIKKEDVIKYPEEKEEVKINAISYDELFKQAESSLKSRGLDAENLEYYDLVSPEELAEIENMLNRPLSVREKWVKSDFIVVFIAASIGSLADICLGARNNTVTGTGSDFSKWLNQFHNHESGAPIDYQGPDFGGGFHRGLSKGHDILRFIEAIAMFKNGQFEAIRYEDGIAQIFTTSVNQYGTPYEQLPIIEALLRYAKHMWADLFSSCSLPFPGSSFLTESGDRQLRIFAADMYRNGFNLKNILIQTVTSTLVVEVILRIYFSCQSVQKYKDSIDVKEDYSNFDAVKQFVTPSNKEKLDELLLVAHAIVTAFNMGKVVIKRAPWEINISEIISVVRYGIRVWKTTLERNSDYAITMRNAREIHKRWIQLENGIYSFEVEEEVIRQSEILVV